MKTEITEKCTEVADDVRGGFPVRTGECIQKLYYTAVMDKAQENRAHENGIRHEETRKALEIMKNL